MEDRFRYEERQLLSVLESVVRCDDTTTVRRDAVRDTIGLFLDDQEPGLARVISDAIELVAL